MFGRRTSSRRRLPRPNAEPFPSKPPSAARRPLVDGVRTRERAVAGRLGAAPYAAPSTNVKASPKSSRTSTNGFGFGFGFGFGDVFFSGVGTVSVSRFLVGCSRAETNFSAASADDDVRRLEPVLVSSSSRTSRRRASSLVTSFVAFFSRRRSSSYASYASSVVFLSKNDESGDETNDGSVPRRGDGDVSPRRRAGDGDGSSRRVSVADRYRTRDGVVDDRFLVCVSRLVRCSIPSPPGPGSNAGRDASSRAVLRNAPRVFEAAAPELVPGRDDHAGLPRAEPPRGGASTLRSTRRPCRSYSITVRQESRLSFEPNEEQGLDVSRRFDPPRGGGSFLFFLETSSLPAAEDGSDAGRRGRFGRASSVIAGRSRRTLALRNRSASRETCFAALRVSPRVGVRVRREGVVALAENEEEETRFPGEETVRALVASAPRLRYVPASRSSEGDRRRPRRSPASARSPARARSRRASPRAARARPGRREHESVRERGRARGRRLAARRRRDDIRVAASPARLGRGTPLGDEGASEPAHRRVHVAEVVHPVASRGGLERARRRSRRALRGRGRPSRDARPSRRAHDRVVAVVAVARVQVVILGENIRLHPELAPELHAERLELARAERRRRHRAMSSSRLEGHRRTRRRTPRPPRASL